MSPWSPSPAFESDIHKSPYIAYTCLRLAGTCAVVGNGSHTDPIAEKLAGGMGMRDALTAVLSGLDSNTTTSARRGSPVSLTSTREVAPWRRFAGRAVGPAFELPAGQALYVATYERDTPGLDLCDESFDVDTAEQACRYVLAEGVFADFERPVLAACALQSDEGFAVASVQE